VASLTRLPGVSRVGKSPLGFTLIPIVEENHTELLGSEYKRVKTFSEMIEWELQNGSPFSAPTHEEDDTSFTGVARSIRHRVRLLARRETATDNRINQAS
jgi:hypothetical protein